jgi:hypothetical protein
MSGYRVIGETLAGTGKVDPVADITHSGGLRCSVPMQKLVFLVVTSASMR